MKLVPGQISHIYEAGIDNMVVLVSTRFNDKNYVMTSSTCAEVSHDPPLLLVSICPDRNTHDKILQRRAFVINILSLKQKKLAQSCGSCSSRDVDKFNYLKIPFTTSYDNLPFIDGCLANLGCHLVSAEQFGDHTIFVGQMYVSRVYGNRHIRHLLLSDVKSPGPSFIPRNFYFFFKRLPLIHTLYSKFKKQI